MEDKSLCWFQTNIVEILKFILFSANTKGIYGENMIVL